MSRLNVGNLFNENEDGAPVVSGISTFSSPNYFVPPSGTTAQRPQNPGEGMIRFNTDSGSLEYYNSELWVDVIVNNNDLGGGLNGIGTTASTQGTGTRAIFCNGVNGSDGTNHIDYITIPTFGDAQDFGDSNTATGTAGGACSDGVKAVFAGGYATGGGGRINTIQFVIMSSTGAVGDFGDLRGGDAGRRGNCMALSNSTRGIFAGGSMHPSPNRTNAIDLITIQSNGNSTDFGDISAGAANAGGGPMSSSVRGVLCIGFISPARVNTVEYITISTTGNSQEFGDLTQAKNGNASFSNSTRGVTCGGEAPGDTNTIEFLTIASTGNGQDFGDLTNVVSNNQGGGASSATRGVVGGGRRSSSRIQDISAIEIQSTGNALDFGDLSNTGRDHIAATSNGHGGL